MSDTTGRVQGSFKFTALVPDSTIRGMVDGARCANCGRESEGIEQVCRSCKLPFVGPNCFPDFQVWETYSKKRKKQFLVDAFWYPNKGRYRVGVPSVPLTEEELVEVEKLPEEKARAFELYHGIAPEKVRYLVQ